MAIKSTTRTNQSVPDENIGVDSRKTTQTAATSLISKRWAIPRRCKTVEAPKRLDPRCHEKITQRTPALLVPRASLSHKSIRSHASRHNVNGRFPRVRRRHHRRPHRKPHRCASTQTLARHDTQFCTKATIRFHWSHKAAWRG